MALGELLFPATPLADSLHGFGELTLYSLFLISLLCLAGSPLGAAMAMLGSLFVSAAKLEEILAGPRQRFREQRTLDRQRSDRMIFSYAVAGVLALFSWAWAAATFGVLTQESFHHEGLIASLVVVVHLLLFLGASAVSLVLARLLSILLRPLTRFAAGRWLVSIPGAAVTSLALAAGFFTWLALTNMEILRVLKLRPVILALLFCLVFLVVFELLRRLRRAARWRLILFSWRRGLPIGAAAFAAVALGAVTLGQRPSARIALSACSSLGVPVVTVLRASFDVDDDGASPWFGGGDCDDFDAEVNPSAFDWPDDGVDQNCLGGDASSEPREPAPFHPVPRSVPRELNAVLISIDSVRADHVGCYGYSRPTTPNLDKLASEGIRFSAGYANSSSTRFSLLSLLTGWRPLSQMRPRKNRAPTWQEILSEKGYLTAAVTGHSYFSRAHRKMKGFKILDNHLARYHKEGDEALASKQTDRAIKLIEQRLKGQRFFLWLHYMDPHHPFPYLPDYSFGRDRTGRYDGEIRHVDHHLGRLFTSLRSLDLWDDTVVIATGDHGQGLGEHGIETHSERLYESLIRVPIIAHVPGLPARVVDQPVSHADLLPTFLNLIRAENDRAFHGTSALGAMLGRDQEPHQVIAEIEMPSGPLYTIITDRWKLIYNESTDSFELYDLENDPGETRNLREERPEIFSALLEPLARHIERNNLDPEIVPILRRSITKTAPEIPHPVEARFGDAIQLMGFDAHPEKVRRGQKLRISFIFKSLNKISDNYKLFVHLYWPGRRRFANLDHHPVKGAFPTKYWRPGQFIRDEFTARVPGSARPGTLKLYFGLFKGRERLPVRGEVTTNDAGNAVVLTEIEVTR